jgi:TPR repeat protein
MAIARVQTEIFLPTSIDNTFTYRENLAAKMSPKDIARADKLTQQKREAQTVAKASPKPTVPEQSEEPTDDQKEFAAGLEAYRNGSHEKALRIWRPLAEHGHAAAQFNLGVMYASGLAVQQDFVEAVKWYRLAAEQGEVSAQFNLGNMYRTGRGVEVNPREAVRWYRMAADRGRAVAQAVLGVMYANGLGVPQDYVQAHVWLSLAAAQGNAPAAKNRDVIASRMTPEQVIEAVTLAHELQSK